MAEQLAWVPDVTRGEWLRPLEAEPFGSILSVVPPGFEAYARVFHPVEWDRPRATKTWQGVDRTTYFGGVRDIEASLETERATWAQAAASFGTTMHAQAQYARSRGAPDPPGRGSVLGRGRAQPPRVTCSGWDASQLRAP